MLQRYQPQPCFTTLSQQWKRASNSKRQRFSTDAAKRIWQFKSSNESQQKSNTALQGLFKCALATEPSLPSELRKCLARNPQERTQTSAVGNDTIYRSCSLDHLLCGKTLACKGPALKSSSAASPEVCVCRTYGRSFSLYSLETELSSHKAMYNTASSCPWTASKKIIFSFSFQTTFSPLVTQWLGGRFCEKWNRKTFL